jgi:hypothetical protein
MKRIWAGVSQEELDHLVDYIIALRKHQTPRGREYSRVPRQ